MQDEIILIDKPSGMTSFGVVARVRRVLSRQAGKKVKVGHCGTLDPFATGLLILVTGKMTRKAMEFTKLDKVYEAEFVLGQVSTTGDPEGEITSYCRPDSPLAAQKRRRVASQSDHSSSATRAADVSEQQEAPRPTLLQIEEVLKRFTGEITQRPPVFSAIKINGQRAYKLAREGKEVEIPERQVTVFSFELLDYAYPSLRIRTHVSSGTYIRSLAVDIGTALGTGAYCRELRRTKIADWDIADAKRLTDFGVTD
ncbi:MAG: tRNA pseudouridine(55) synthase TruB [Candidatus Saccharimonas sp.]